MLMPATIDHAEQLMFARDFIMQLSKVGEVGSPFEAAEGCRFVRKPLEFALQTADGRMWLTDIARLGEPESQSVLRDIILELKSRHEELPTELAHYDMQLTRGDIAPAKWGGPKKKNELTRNICIALTVAAVADRFGLRPTGRSARRRSACAIVAEALDAIHMKLGYEAVKAIWNGYGDNMPRGAAFWAWGLDRV